MALRARLVAPPPATREIWPFHSVKCGSISLSTIATGERRLEAETYLSAGYGIRLALESSAYSCTPLGSLCHVWKPGRAKGILTSQEFGIPFLAATQVFDSRPIARKWIAKGRIRDENQCFSSPGEILVTCSGSVGRATVATVAIANMLVSNDLLRVNPINSDLRGWVYAYLRSDTVRAMATSTQYGHMIKHLETFHLENLPIPEISKQDQIGFVTALEQIVELRNRSYAQTLQAESEFTAAVTELRFDDVGENGFIARASNTIFKSGKRIDAACHNPHKGKVLAHLRRNGNGFSQLSKSGYEIWVPGRYKRIPAEDGIVYRDSADILEVSPDLNKRFADCRFGDKFRGRVRSGWILMPSSGQIYGIIGTPVLATEALDGQVVSNHVIRIAPRENASIAAGYATVALQHPVFGRPLVKALAFGSSVPEISPEAVAELPIVRLSQATESRIATLAEDAALCRAQADLIERAIAERADSLLEESLRSNKAWSSTESKSRKVAERNSI